MTNSPDRKFATAIAFAAWAVATVAIVADAVAPAQGRRDAGFIRHDVASYQVTPQPRAHPLRVGQNGVSLAAIDEDAATASVTASEGSVRDALQTAAQQIDREMGCLAQAIYYEARSESYSGQVAVAEVVMNRMRSQDFPDSVCGVVYQGMHRQTGCQFTFTCDGSLDLEAGGRSWDRAQKIAKSVIYGMTDELTDDATHYHADYVSPRWAPHLIQTARIGRHIFYRVPTRSASLAK